MALQTKYLNRFKYLVGSQQAQEALAKVELDKESGKIKTLADLKKELDALIPKVSDRTLTPLARPITFREGDKINLDELNNALSLMISDLTTLFTEVDNVNSILENQDAIIFRHVSKDLRKAINRIEAEIETQELLAQLNQINTHTFSSSEYQGREGEFVFASRVDSLTRGLYADPRTGKTLSKAADCSVTDDDNIQLPITSNIIHLARGAYLEVDRSGLWPSAASEISVESDKLSVFNLIDNKQDTFWARLVLVPTAHTTELSNTNSQGVKHKIRLDFDSLITFNNIRIEPIPSNEVYLIAIQGCYNNTWSTLWSATSYTNGINMKAPRTLYFDNTRVTSLRLVFESRSSKLSTFDKEVKGDDTWQIPEEQPSIERLLRSRIRSPQLQASLGVSQETVDERQSYIEYFFGLDNIKIGTGVFGDTGIFVSAPMEFKNPLTKLGVFADWLIPYRALTSTSIEFTDAPETDIGDGTSKEILGTIELYLKKWDYNANGILVNSTFHPLLPLFRGRTVYERLLLTEKASSTLENDHGTLNFYADDIDDVLLFQDGEPLVKETDWVEADSQDSINTRQRMSHGISLKSPIRDSAYTAIYSAMTTNIEGKPQYDGTSWVTNSTVLHYNDIVGDMGTTLDEHGFYLFDILKNSQDGRPEVRYATSKIAIVAVLRNCTKGRYTGVTPVLKNFRVLAFEKAQDEE